MFTRIFTLLNRFRSRRFIEQDPPSQLPLPIKRALKPDRCSYTNWQLISISISTTTQSNFREIDGPTVALVRIFGTISVQRYERAPYIAYFT